MSEVITDRELEAVRASTRAHLAELLGEAGLAGDVVALERVGIALLAAFDAPQSPPELGAVLIDALIDRGCETSIGVLAVLAAFGSEKTARDAARAARRFDDRPAKIAGVVGSLTVREVWHGELPSAEVWVAVLDRPGRDELQAACVTLEVSDEGPIPVDALLTEAGPVAELDSALALLAAGAKRSTVAALAERLSAAVANTGKAELAVPLEFGVCLPLLARAIGGEAHALGRVTTYAEVDEDQEQDELFTVDEAIEETLLDELVRDYGRYVYATHGADSAVWRHGEFISCALLETLRQTCERLAQESADACHDPSCWGMAKSFAMQMMTDGVDLADLDAGEAWIVARDLRQVACGETQPSRRRAAGSGRAKRTAAKQARRRNRS
jgi:hypothetical protein